MALPPTVRVKLSSEAAGAIALTPVVVREIPSPELIEHMLGITGKDELRIQDLLRRGTLVSGASRFRWAGWEADVEGIREILATFPDPDPARPFDSRRCVRVVLRGGRRAVEITREAGMRKRLLRRSAFWDVLMEIAAAPPTVYASYSYRDRADRYLREFTAAEAGRIRAGSESVKFPTLRALIRSVGFLHAELFVTR